MSIKTGLYFLSDFPLYHYSNFWYCNSYCIMENLKKSGKHKDKLRATHPKNLENFTTASLGSNLLVLI